MLLRLRLPGFVGAFLLVQLASASPGDAQINVTGRWQVAYADTVFSGMVFERTIDLVQSGTAVTASYYSSGTIDPGSGALHLEGTGLCYDPFFQPVPVPRSLDAVVAPDGTTFDGTFDEFASFGRSCLGLGGPVHGVKVSESCGNGVPDAGEACDAGPSGDACCTEICTARPAGTSCPSDGLNCSIDACDGAGACAHTPVAAGTLCRLKSDACDLVEVCDGLSPACPPDARLTEPDDDGDGIVDSCDDCVAAPPSASRLRLGRFSPSGGADFVSLHTRVTLPPGHALPDPRGSWKLVDLRDATGAPVVYAQVPGGAYDPALGLGWQRRGSSWVYRSDVEGFGQVSRLTLTERRAPAGTIDVRIRTPRTTLGTQAPVLPLRLKLILDGFGPSVTCGEESFSAAGGPAPACRWSHGGSILTCR